MHATHSNSKPGALVDHVGTTGVPDLLHGNEQRMYGVSAERIRQIEVAAMKKMKKTLAEFA